MDQGLSGEFWKDRPQGRSLQARLKVRSHSGSGGRQHAENLENLKLSLSFTAASTLLRLFDPFFERQLVESQ
jgi:hypothetical protein